MLLRDGQHETLESQNNPTVGTDEIIMNIFHV